MSCDPPRSFRVNQVAGMFDLNIDKAVQSAFDVEVPDLSEAWRVGAIVGPSGSGKSTVARRAFGDHLHNVAAWPAGKAVVDCFDESHTIKDIVATLTAVGFSSPPAWIKPYDVLSNGEKFRCDLARALLDHRDIVAFDEFTSVVDRTVARIGSAAVAKAVRRSAGQRFVAVTCHYDVLEWLEPDWVLDMASGQLARGCLQRRPPITLKIHRSHHRHWRLFAKHHYLDASEIPGSTCYVAEWNGVPVSFVSVRTSLGFTGQRRISRIVTLPDYQGVGIGIATLNAVADITQRQPGVTKVSIRTGHPAMLNALSRNQAWRCSDYSKTGGGKHTFGNKGSTGRCVATFVYRPDAIAARTTSNGTENMASCPR